MRVLVSEGDIMMGDLTFEQDTVTVGSLAENSICLPGRKVAERHVVFTRNEDKVWFVESTDPELPTTANNIELRNRVPLQEGMTIGIGRFRLKCFLHWSVRHDEAAADYTIEQMALLRRHHLPRGTIIKSHHEEMAVGPGWSDRIAVIGGELDQCPDLRVLMDYTLDMLVKVFGSAMVYMGARARPASRFEYVEGRTNTGAVAELPKLGQHMVYRSVERAQHLCAVRVDAPPVTSAMSVPLITTTGNLGVLYLDSRTEKQNYKPRHLDLFSVIASHVSQRLGRVLVGEQHQREEETRGELGLIRAVQTRMEPSPSAGWSNFEVAAHCRPGRLRCSDVFEVTRQPNGTAALLLARVRGERTEAAITVPEVRSAFRTAMLHGDLPQAVLKVLNLTVAGRNRSGQVDAVCLQIDPDSGRVACAGAGEIAPLVLAASGEARPLMSKGAPPLGTEEKPLCAAYKGKLQRGDILVLCTPGLQSVTDAEGVPLCREHVLESLKECFGQTLHQTLEEVVAELFPAEQEVFQADDLTLVLAARTG